MKFLYLIILIPHILLSQSFFQLGELAQFENALDFTINQTGDIYISDINSDMILRIDTSGNIIRKIGGFGWKESSFDDPVDIFANTLNVYVTDKNNHRIQFFDRELNFLYDFNSSRSENPEESFRFPVASAVSGLGNLFVIDSENRRIIKFDLDGSYLLEFGSYNAGEYILRNPLNLDISADGRIFVIDETRLIIFDRFGTGLKILDLDFLPLNISISDGIILLTAASGIYRFEILQSNILLQKLPFQLPEDEKLRKALQFRKKIYLLTDKKLIVYESH